MTFLYWLISVVYMTLLQTSHHDSFLFWQHFLHLKFRGNGAIFTNGILTANVQNIAAMAQH